MTLTDDDDDDGEEKRPLPLTPLQNKADKQLLQKLGGKYALDDPKVARRAVEVVKTLDSSVVDALLKIELPLLKVSCFV